MATQFEDLLKVDGIVQGIADFLGTNDYLSFRRVNKLVYEKQLNGKWDITYWTRKLIRMGIEPSEEDEEDEISLLTDDSDAMSFFDDVKTFKPKKSRQCYKTAFKCYQRFIDKLFNYDMSNFFPVEYSDPLSQAKVLNGISRYNRSNVNEYGKFKKVQENLQVLRELFVNTLLKELDLVFGRRELETSAKLIKALLVSHEEQTAVDFFKSRSDFAKEVTLPEKLFSIESKSLDDEALSCALSIMLKFFNDKIKLVDILFGNQYPVIVSYLEGVIAYNVSTYFAEQVSNSENQDTETESWRLLNLPQIYTTLTDALSKDLDKSENGGPHLNKMVQEFFNLYLENKIVLFLSVSVQSFNERTRDKLREYQRQSELKEKEQNEQIYNTLKGRATNEQLIGEKNDFLTSFTKMFRMSSSKSGKDEQLKFAVSLNVMNSNLRNIQSLVSLALCCEITEDCRNCVEQMCIFLSDTSVIELVKSHCQQLFKYLIFQLSENHLQTGFTKAIEYLKKYNGNEINSLSLEMQDFDTQVEPLVKFAELINIGDIILQMTTIFYNNELIHKGIMNKNKDFLNDVVQVKKNFELALDDYVAEGLNVGINKLMNEVLFVFSTLQLPSDYNPDSKQGVVTEMKPTKAAVKNIELLTNHCFLLTGATDKGTVDVFQQEVGERFFDEVVKNIKKNLISTEGAIFLICDLNLYYEFFTKRLKQKSIVPLFAGLKAVGQLFLVSPHDSKELGKMICDLEKFQGVFTQEEIYEFVQRRTDWVKVRRDVEKVMYGLGVSDCAII
ncbi:LAMI_0G07514g1_1 [Lachancea mirantina]|uniref:LAMI_0G07514g1_1 n=1 Tax=Lachancea mirantina TaxID=1230905 RepID=A0A1G4K9M6_9SACH|nr:LAMI_0G07514g1_1 [Lachancea mirantina]